MSDTPAKFLKPFGVTLRQMSKATNTTERVLNYEFHEKPELFKSRARQFLQSEFDEEHAAFTERMMLKQRMIDEVL